jgi:hypothetical protein
MAAGTIGAAPLVVTPLLLPLELPLLEAPASCLVVPLDEPEELVVPELEVPLDEVSSPEPLELEVPLEPPELLPPLLLFKPPELVPPPPSSPSPLPPLEEVPEQHTRLAPTTSSAKTDPWTFAIAPSEELVSPIAPD